MAKKDDIKRDRKNISCQVSPEFFESISDAAHYLKMSKSEFMRSAISYKLKCLKNDGKLL